MNAEEELKAWEEWRARCAVALLEEEQRIWLTGVIAKRFRLRLRKLAAAGIWSGSPPDAPSERECAHLFESHLQLHQRRDGKSYKHWLLTRGRRDLDTVQSGVMLLIRNVVKDWVKHTHPRTAPLSLQETFGSDVTLEQCLPGEVRDLQSPVRIWVLEQLQSWAESLAVEEKRMLAIRAKGWVFSSPRALAVAGVGKTTLHKLHRSLLKTWADRIMEAHPGVEASEASAALLEAMDQAGERFLHLLMENRIPAAFKEAKDPHGD